MPYGWRSNMPLTENKENRTSRDMTTPTSRPVSMISSDHNLNPVIDVRLHW